MSSDKEVLIKELFKLLREVLTLSSVIEENKKRINNLKRDRELSAGYLGIVHEIFSGNEINDGKRNYGLELLDVVIRKLSNGDQK